MAVDRARAGPTETEGDLMRLLVRLLDFLFSVRSLFALVGATVEGYVFWLKPRDLPDYTQLQVYAPPAMNRVHASDGTLLAEYARERRLYLPIQGVSPRVIHAFMSAEDKNFYTHNGVDPEGILRALFANFQNRGSGKRPQGASTIT